MPRLSLSFAIRVRIAKVRWPPRPLIPRTVKAILGLPPVVARNSAGTKLVIETRASTNSALASRRVLLRTQVTGDFHYAAYSIDRALKSLRMDEFPLIVWNEGSVSCIGVLRRPASR
jgi:hypothetical protein